MILKVSQRLRLALRGDLVDHFAEARVNLTDGLARIALSGCVDVDPALAVRSAEPAFDLGSPVLRLADVGLAVALEAPAFTGAIFPRDVIDDDFDLALAIGAAITFDGEGH